MAGPLGGNPGISILTGVAQGIMAKREQEERQRQQAIRDRLLQAQAETMEAATNARAAEAANREVALRGLTEEIMRQNPGISERDAAMRAFLRLDSNINVGKEERDKRADDQLAASRTRDAQEDEAEAQANERVESLVGDAEFRSEVAGFLTSKTARDKDRFIRAAEKRGYKTGAATEAWDRLSKNTVRPPRPAGSGEGSGARPRAGAVQGQAIATMDSELARLRESLDPHGDVARTQGKGYIDRAVIVQAIKDLEASARGVRLSADAGEFYRYAVEYLRDKLRDFDRAKNSADEGEIDPIAAARR